MKINITSAYALLFISFVSALTNFTCPSANQLVFHSSEKDALGDGYDFSTYRINRVSQFSEQPRLQQATPGFEFNRPERLRVVDSFTLLNEIETLFIRLNELDPYVDTFLIMEAKETFSGNERNLTFPTLLQSRRIQRFLPKIVFKVCDFPGGMAVHDNNFKMIWAREKYIRNTCLKNELRALPLRDEDLFIFSDIDEIPSGRTLSPHYFMTLSSDYMPCNCVQ